MQQLVNFGSAMPVWLYLNIKEVKMGFFKSIAKKAKRAGRSVSKAAKSVTKQAKKAGDIIETATDKLNDNPITSTVIDTAGGLIGVSNLSDKLEDAGDVIGKVTSTIDAVTDLQRKGFSLSNITAGLIPTDDSILNVINKLNKQK